MMHGTVPSERVQRRIDRLLDQAEEAVDARDWESARDAADAVLAADPTNEDAQTFLAMAERRLGGLTGSTVGIGGVSGSGTSGVDGGEAAVERSLMVQFRSWVAGTRSLDFLVRVARRRFISPTT